MKKLLFLAGLGLFGVAMVGCHMSADVDPPDNAGSQAVYKKGETKTIQAEVTREISGASHCV